MRLGEKVLGVFIDALRPDFITPRDTPFLHRLARRCGCAPIETILGYSDAIDASIFTGTYPDVHGYWMKYHYDPGNSVYRDVAIFKYLGWIDLVPSAFVRSGINYTLYNTLYRYVSKKMGCSGLASYNIPYRFLGNFNLTTRKTLFDRGVFGGIPTIFDVLARNGRSYSYIHGARGNDIDGLAAADLGIAYFSDIDLAAHIFGLRSGVFRRSLRRLDKKVEALVSRYRRINPGSSLIIFADHGMADVHTILKFGELYGLASSGRLMFALDGTMVRFWYSDDGARDAVRGMYGGAEYGHFLGEGEKRGLRIGFGHRRYGDDVFLLDQGYAVFPNFMSWNRPRAMHAYHPRHAEQMGAVIVDGGAFGDGGAERRPARIVDVMPTMLDILSIDVPPTVEGTSLIDGKR